MGGQIAIADHPDGGSTFWFEVDFEPSASVRPRRRPRGTLRGAHVLVVDDLEINRLIFAEQLAAEGAIVAQAASGPEALLMIEAAQAGHRSFGLVLLDHMMPGMAGDQVAVHIRAQAGWIQPRLVLASSLGLMPASEGRAAFDACLSKPVRRAELLESLGRVLGRPSPTVRRTRRPAAAPSAARSGRILLAEDHEINRFLATTLLHSAGYEVECAANGVEAVRLARETAFDLILMDVHMPLMDGLEAARAVRALGETVRQPRIVALTANAQSSDRDECFAAGMDDFITKPFDPERFLDTVALNMTASEPKAIDVSGSGCG